MKKIDFEHHYYIPEALEVMGVKRNIFPWYEKETNTIWWTKDIAEPQEIIDKLLMREDERVAYMDSCGLDVAVLSSAPGIDELGDDSVDLCRKINDDIALHCKRFPDRFLGSASLPMHDMDAACDELKRCVEELGFVGWHAHSNVLGKGLDDDFFMPLFKCAQDLGVYVYLHPRCSHNERLTGFDFNLAGPGLGFTIDAQITIIKLMIKGTFDRLPKLTIMLGHLAEGLGFYLDRMQSRLHVHPSDAIKMEKDVKYYFANNIMTSTSGNTNREAFMLTKNVIGIDRMVIGSDVPFEHGKNMIEFLESLSLTDEERQKLYYENAMLLINKK